MKIYLNVPSICRHVFIQMMTAFAGEFREMGYETTIVEDLNDLEKNSLLILFGYQGYVDRPDILEQLSNYKVVIFNAEQLPTGIWDNIIHEWNNYLAIWDYSVLNIQYLKSKGVHNTFLVPLGYSKYFKVMNLCSNRNKEIVFFGTINERREKMMENIKKSGYNVKYIEVWDENYKQVIRENQVFLNIHYYQPSILEYFRIIPILSNKGIVISERSNDPFLDILVSKYVYWIDGDNILGQMSKIYENMQIKDWDQKYKEFKQEVNLSKSLQAALIDLKFV